MDDLIDCSSKEKASNFMKEIDEVLSLGGFTIKGWTSTSSNISSTEQQAKVVVTLIEKDDGKEKVLGIIWNPVEDRIYYNAKLNFSKRVANLYIERDLLLERLPEGIPSVLTKRQILSQINGIYDPLGLMSPFVIKGKMLLRE